MRSHSRIITLVFTCATLITACGPEDGKSSQTDASSTGSTGEATTVEPTGGSSGSSGSSGSTSSEGSTGATSEGSGSSGGTGPDPNYERECQPKDFVCNDWGCQNDPVVKLGECYKPCTPDVVGEKDSECDEPERPFCSQVGLALGGDFDCNGCAHICVSASFNHCDQDAMACPVN